MPVRRLVIDIGTNTVLALLADVSDHHLSVISDQRMTTRLGEGLAVNGSLSSAAILRTVEAVVQFAKGANYNELIMIGTEALRMAHNSSDFIKLVKDAVGKEPVIISGLTEAALSFLGSTRDLVINAENILLIDVGGGSTELVMARGGTIGNALSVPIGALRLKETVKGHGIKGYIDEAKRVLLSIIVNLKIPPSLSIIATGGTITSSAAIKMGNGRFDAATVHGSILRMGDIKEIVLKFEKADSESRMRLIPFDPERAELILPGLGIFLAILGIIGQDSLMVSVGGIRYGAALNPEKIRP